MLTNLESKRLEKVVQSLSGKGRIACYDKDGRAWIATPALDRLMENGLARAADFHRREPLKPGMAKGVLLSGLGSNLPPKLAHFVLERLLKTGALVAEDDLIRLADHRVSLASDQSALKEALLKAHTETPMTPPNLKDVLEALEISPKEAAPVLKLLQTEGSLVKIKEGLYFAAPAVDDLKERTRVWFRTHDDLNPGDFKELSGGLSRKYVIPLLEFFDKERFTVRVGDKRQLRGKAGE